MKNFERYILERYVEEVLKIVIKQLNDKDMKQKEELEKKVKHLEKLIILLLKKFNFYIAMDSATKEYCLIDMNDDDKKIDIYSATGSLGLGVYNTKSCGVIQPSDEMKNKDSKPQKLVCFKQLSCLEDFINKLHKDSKITNGMYLCSVLRKDIDATLIEYESENIIVVKCDNEECKFLRI